MLIKEKSSNLKVIAKSIDALNLTEQLWLLERIAHQIRIRNELVAMAQDPQIQAELSQIQQESAVTDFDGL
ncbi:MULTISPECIES: hypothetical protein [Pseudanabaena]|uniref:hypothetical protein n=1 Tax=Pseudanabaena TaxID=1152 RepID=UPI0024791096|nr:MULTISPECIES: hypothetical protein [Pseudanabaena]MEA5487873.1 hypothetical protein [Pseudanabaena sp. CCNP1317]WGS72177.1 hypothetical protein OA858_21105 [Pseudanabaena galeata CCNP1313]